MCGKVSRSGHRNERVRRHHGPRRNRDRKEGEKEKMSSYTLQAEIESKRPTELIEKETRTHGRESAHTPRQKKKEGK